MLYYGNPNVTKISKANSRVQKYKCCKLKGTKVQKMLQTQGSKSTKVVDAAISREQKYKSLWMLQTQRTKVVDAQVCKNKSKCNRLLARYFQYWVQRTEVCLCTGTESELVLYEVISGSMSMHITCTNFMLEWSHASADVQNNNNIIMCKHYLGAGRGTRCRYE